RPMRHPEGGELRLAEAEPARGLEELLVARVRPRVPALDDVDAEVVQALDDAQLVVEGEGDVLGLGAVAQRGVVELDALHVRAVPPCSVGEMNASCRARTASSVYFASMTTEILISDVEIIWMLMPSPASTSNMRAAMPACVRIPTPTIDTFATSSCPATPCAPMSFAVASTSARAFS